MSHSRSTLKAGLFFAEATVPDGPHDDRTCVVFVHGLGGNSTVHYPIQEVVAEQVRTVSLDLLGLGRSHQSWPASFNDWVEQIERAVDAAGTFDRLLLVGHSLGTLVSRHVAARDDRVVAQVLFGPIPAVADAQRAAFVARADAAVTQGMVAVADGFGIATLSQATRNDRLIAVAFVRDLLMGQDAPAYAMCCKVLGRATEAAAPRNRECHTLLVRGGDDPVSSHAAVVAVAQALQPATSRTVVLDAVGHWPQLENPERSLSLAQEYFADHVTIKSERRNNQ